MTNGWDESAAAWLAHQGETGDSGRAFILDPAMLGRVRGRPFRRALDVGCGEGRFCRLLAAEGIEATGLEPTAALLAAARARDPAGRYVDGRAEALPFDDGEFDLVVSYLTLIDIADHVQAIGEMARVLAPGGALLIANLNGFTSAGLGLGWIHDESGARLCFAFDHYLEERAVWAEWAGIRVQNWHRPLGAYMRALLGAGLVLRHFDEPPAHGGDPEEAAFHRRAPWFLVMEWEKP
jgi:SAM-dependent methyltransferase